MCNQERVMFVVSPFFGGASRMTINIAKLLLPLNYEVVFLCYGPKMEEIKNYIPEGCKTICLNIRNIWDFTTIKLIKIFKREKITQIFCSFAFINSRVAVAAKIVGGIRIILRSSNSLSHFSIIDNFLIRLTYPLADVVIAQQDEMRTELISCIPKISQKTIVLQNILDTEAIEQNLQECNPYKDNDETRYIWMGRVTRTKGYDVLLKAFLLVKQRISNAHLYLLGRYEHDAFFSSLVTFIKENNLQECVHFEGLLPNPHVWIKNADCFVLPSRLEGLPNALIEAMYIGKPVVSTLCVPIISRIVKDGYNGYVVSPENIEELADAMVKALSLKNFKMTYKASKKENFVSLFCKKNEKK